MLSTALVVTTFAQSPAPMDRAAVLLRNGHVFTPSGWSTSVAYRDGKIIAVGSDAYVRSRVGAGTREVDLAGHTVFPGLHDMHVHPLSAGSLMVQCTFKQGATPEQILAKVAECARTRKPGEWVEGGSWQAISFGDHQPTRQMLDSVSPDNPVILRDIAGHSVWLNSLALKKAGINRDTPVPAGGIIERDAAGEPTGILREAAQSLGRSAVPARSLEDTAAAIERALAVLVSYGITTATDAGFGQDSADAYKLLSDQNRLLPRVRGCILYKKVAGNTKAFDTLLDHRENYRLPHFTPDCVKFMVDGVPTESHTAAMLEPYQNASSAKGSTKDDRGSLQIAPPELNAMALKIDKLGLIGKFHAVGDAASDAVLNAIALARAQDGPNGPRHDIAHTTFITQANIARAKTLKVTLEFSPYLWFPAVINDDIIKAVGEPRIDRAWPIRDAVRSGVRIDVGSDWPAGTPTASPWFAMEALVTRRTPDGSRGSQTFAPGQAIDLARAVHLFTVDGAQQMGNLDTSGTIEVGKDADLIVLDRNPFKIPITDVHNVIVEQTIVGGVTVYTHTK
ncbi:MAG: amidohydrolase [Steroidobacteraceae bacterium]